MKLYFNGAKSCPSCKGRGYLTVIDNDNQSHKRPCLHDPNPNVNDAEAVMPFMLKDVADRKPKMEEDGSYFIDSDTQQLISDRKR